MNELTVYNENKMDFKKRIFGGYDKLDVLKKVKDLNLKYQGLMQSQKDYYESIIEQLKNGEEVSSLSDFGMPSSHNISTNNGIKKISEDEIEELLQKQKSLLVAIILEMQQHYDQRMDNYQDNMEENVNHILRLVNQKVDELKMNDGQ